MGGGEPGHRTQNIVKLKYSQSDRGQHQVRERGSKSGEVVKQWVILFSLLIFLHHGTTK